MKVKFFSITAALLVALLTPISVSAQTGDTVLKAGDTQKLLPASVFFRGQSATTQLRNSGGVKFADGYFVLAAAVDTSGYSTDVSSKYQDYFITEVPLTIGGHSVAPGAYGIGFIADNKFVVLDIGGHELFTVESGTDSEMKRPMPLTITEAGNLGYRLYSGRRYVVFKR